MQIMGCRYDELALSLTAMERGAVPFVKYQFEGFHPLGPADDLGSYYFIPKLAVWFNLPLELAIDVFYFGLLGLSIVVGAIGLVCYLRNWTGRAVALAALGVTAARVVECSDVYLTAPCCIIACIPWAFWLAERAERTSVLIAGGTLLGLAFGFANLIRGQAGTGVLLATLILVGFAVRHSYGRRIGFIAAMIAGLIIPSLYQTHLLNQADAFLRSQSPHYAGRSDTAHPLWHSIYIGLGYLQNSYGIAYNDTSALQAAQAVNPNVLYMSPEYDRILRDRVWALFQRDRDFIYRTFFSKAGYVAFYFLKHAHIGLLLACCGVLSRRQSAALACVAVFSALPGVLVMPQPNYLLGLRAAAAFMVVIGLGRCCEHDWEFSRFPSRFTPRWETHLFFARRRGATALRFALIAIAGCVTTKYAYRSYGTAAKTVAASYHDLRRPTVKQPVAADNLPRMSHAQLAKVSSSD